MTDTKMIMGSLALDLKRAALGYHNGSIKTADRFYKEALLRISELDVDSLKPYIKQHIEAVKRIEEKKDIEQRAEDALTYSTIIQNYCLHYC